MLLLLTSSGALDTTSAGGASFRTVDFGGGDTPLPATVDPQGRAHQIDGVFTEASPMNPFSRPRLRRAKGSARPQAASRAMLETLEGRRMLTAAMPGDVRHEIMTVPLDGSVVTSTFIPEAGKTYHLRASGTTGYIDTPNGRRTDAEYYDYQAGPALDLSSPNLGSVDVGLKLIDRMGEALSGFHWGPYQSSHAYVEDFVGTGEALNVRYIDVPGFYGDNSGTLSFQIYEPVKVNVLKVSDANDLEWQRESASAGAAQPFYLTADGTGSAAIVIDGIINPDRSDSRAMSLWKIDAQGNLTSRSSGRFSDTLANRTVTFTNVTGDSYTLTAGADKNENGVLDAGEVERTVSIHVNVLPRPDPISAASNSGDSITVTWIGNSSAQTGFVVERATGTGPFDTSISVGPNEESHTFTGLTGGTTYRFRVKAVDLVIQSAYSPETSATVMTAPQAPSALSADPFDDDEDGGGIALGWTDNSDNEAEFEIRRATDSAFVGNLVMLDTDRIDQTGHSDREVAATVTYYYQIRAVNGAGVSAWSNTASATAAQRLPRRPDALYALATPTGVQLTWDDASGNETGYRIERTTDPEFGSITSIPLDADTASYFDSTATANGTYYYRVVATGLAGDSRASEVATVDLPGGVPAPVSDVGAMRVRDTATVVEWNDNSDNEEGFEIQRSTDPDFDPLVTQGFTVAYNQTSFTDEGLTQGVTYYYRVRPFNAYDPLEDGSGGALGAPVGEQQNVASFSTNWVSAVLSAATVKFNILKQGAPSFTEPTAGDWFYSGTAVHVQASDGTLVAFPPASLDGNGIAYRYDWDFGDSGSLYNGAVVNPTAPIEQHLQGMSAAHIFYLPRGRTTEKTYTIRLRITPSVGQPFIQTATITIKPDTRTITKVSNNPQLHEITFSTLLQRFATRSASQLSNQVFLFRRGETFKIDSTIGSGINRLKLTAGTSTTPLQNVVFGSYKRSADSSTAAKPIIRGHFGDPDTEDGRRKAPMTDMIEFDRDARNIMFRDVEFDSAFVEANLNYASGRAPQVLAIKGAANVTVLNADIGRVASLFAERTRDGSVKAEGLLVQGSRIAADRSTGYYVMYVVGTRNLTLLGNHFEPDRATMHLVRLDHDNSFALIHDNEMGLHERENTHAGITSLRVSVGEFISATNNTFREISKLSIGPAETAPSEKDGVIVSSDTGKKMLSLIFDGNLIERGGLAIGVGLQRSVIRNNIFTDKRELETIKVDDGRSSNDDGVTRERPDTDDDRVKDVWIVHNTRYNPPWGKPFLNWDYVNATRIRMRQMHVHNNLTAGTYAKNAGGEYEATPIHAKGITVHALKDSSQAWHAEITRSLQGSPAGWTIGGNTWSPRLGTQFRVDGTDLTLDQWNQTYTQGLDDGGNTINTMDYGRNIYAQADYAPLPYIPIKNSKIVNFLNAPQRFSMALWDAYGTLRPSSWPTTGAVQRP